MRKLGAANVCLSYKGKNTNFVQQMLGLSHIFPALLKKYEHFSNTFISSEANEKDKRDRQLKAASPNNKREKWRKKNARTISTWLSGCRMFKKTSPTPRRRVSQSQNENVWQEVALKSTETCD